MLNRIPLALSLMALCVSCGPGTGEGTPVPVLGNDSIHIYYARSRDKAFTLGERSRAVNRALSLMGGNVRDSLFGYLLYQKNNLHLHSGQYDSLLYHHERFKNHDSLMEDDRNKGRQYYLMAYYHREIAKDYEKAYLNFTQARNHYEQLKDSSWVGRILLYMGSIEKDQNDFFGSKETLTEALRYLKSPGDDPSIAQAYNVLATDHRKLANFGDAVIYYKNALKKAGSDIEKRSFENNLAATYMDDGQYEKSMEILQGIIADTALERTSGQYARILDNLSYARWLSGEDLGEGPFLQALEIRKTKKDRRGQIASYTHLGEYQSRRDPKRAKAYFDSVIHLS